MSKTKLILIVAIVAAIASYSLFDLGRFLTLEYAQSQISTIQNFRDENFALTALSYFFLYVAVTALSIPGALIVTLIGGAIFGLLWGTLIVSFASSIGATLAFLVSRTLLRDWVQSRFGDYLAPINIQFLCNNHWHGGFNILSDFWIRRHDGRREGSARGW